MTTIVNYSIIIKIVLFIVISCDTYPLEIERSEYNKFCRQLPSMMLTEILGPAFNSRYMSINEPLSLNSNDMSMTNGKRDLNELTSFYVDGDYKGDLSNKPAWDVLQHVPVQTKVNIESDTFEENGESIIKSSKSSASSTPEKRSHQYRSSKSSSVSLRPWECEAKIRWIDLGPNYFPRFLRTIECTKHLCWYGHYTCQPRSFTIKLLRRRAGECAFALSTLESSELNQQYENTRNAKTDMHGLPGDLRELWIWEERAVNFCCDCTAP